MNPQHLEYIRHCVRMGTIGAEPLTYHQWLSLTDKLEFSPAAQPYLRTAKSEYDQVSPDIATQAVLNACLLYQF